METEIRKNFVQSRLPWIIAAGGLLVYLVTLNTSLTFRSLPSLARAAGWDWQLAFQSPLNYLLTYPIRWLPGSIQLIALNLFAALCAAGSLGLLARSVAILPHDRTRDQRALERSEYSFLSIRSAWVPPVFAAAVCGLQLTYWQNAVVATGEALDLLLFAYVLRCVLEYRIDQRESWLTRSAFVYGLAITNNFAMIPFLAVYLGALFWILGVSFFNWRFLLRMFLCGLAGLLLYLLLPLLHAASDLSHLSFLQAARIELGAQKNALLNFPRYIVLLLSLTSIFPLIFIGIRWPAQFGEASAAGTALTNLMTHVIHGVFLVTCLSVTLDPPWGPKNVGFGFALLPIYYLGALSIGYFVGYFLLVFGIRRQEKVWQRLPLLRRVANYGIQAAVWLAVLGMPIALAARNAPKIWAANQGFLSDYALAAAKSLPPEGGIVLSDDGYQLYSVQSALRRQGRADKYALVDTRSLTLPAYHRYLSRRYPERWPAYLGERRVELRVEPAALLLFFTELYQNHALYYLHPSFGYYFETFYQEPRQLIYQLKRYPTNTVAAPELSKERIGERAQYLRSVRQSQLMPLIAAIPKNQKIDFLPPDAQAILMGARYSRAINDFGVAAQRSGALEVAGEMFEYALELNPQSPAAFINRDYNAKLQAGDRENPEPSEGAVERLQPYRGNWDDILGVNGPVDEPNSCYHLARALTRGGNYRQAAQELLRVVYFQPDNLSAHLALANMYMQIGMADRALGRLDEIEKAFGPKDLGLPDQLAIAEMRAWAYAAGNDFKKAEEFLMNLQEKHPQQSRPFRALVELYLSRGQVTNALSVLNKQLDLQPWDIQAQINYAALKIDRKDFEGAVKLLDRALEQQPQNGVALMNRAIANLKLGNLDAAQRDYETLRLSLPRPLPSVYFGLGEIAWRKKQRESALRYYDEYLKLTPPSSPEVQFIRDRIKTLKSGSF